MTSKIATEQKIAFTTMAKATYAAAAAQPRSIMSKSLGSLLILCCILATETAAAWTSKSPKQATNVASKEQLDLGISKRRTFVASLVVPLLLPAAAQAAATRAVGSGEIACRQAGNCLEVGEWDGAIGWGWGGKDRCDASDPMCGTDGKLRENAIVGKAVPTIPTTSSTTDEQQQPVRFTHIAAIQIEVGRGEIGVLKLGFYGNGAAGAVSQLVAFLSENGFTAESVSSSRQLQSMIGAVQPAVSLQTGGVVTAIVPHAVVELGVPIQSNAYARSLGRSKAGDNFVPQPRPPPFSTAADRNGDNNFVVRPHDCAGLVSLPEKGLGYGGTGFESEDECYESAFLITADAVPAFDDTRSNKRRVVVGQVLDAESMAFLERLANVPTKRGIRGVIPGQTSGPPLPKVVVRKVQVSKVSA